MKTYTVSVRDIVETVLLSGDIDNRYIKKGRMQEGSEIHRMLQKRYGEEDLSEVTVRRIIETDQYTLAVQGRIDGVLSFADDPIIEEIKSTVADLERIDAPDPIHLAQAKLYACFYSAEHQIETIRIRMTYYGIESKQSKHFDQSVSSADMELFFADICKRYLLRLDFREGLTNRRDASISDCVFPFSYRKYQKQIVRRIYKAVEEKKNIFINAPTGSGKTLNALFPAIKLLPTSGNGKLFYLSSKSTQKQIAENTLRFMEDKGLNIKSVTITAKEKACFLDHPSCNPEDCPYAAAYYDKLPEAIQEILSEASIITAEFLQFYAAKHKMCPFELSLDLSNWADIIICDYNYVFDPFAALKRYFDDTAPDENHLFLIDEAHNLIDRSRDMYSLSLEKQAILNAKRSVSTHKKLTKSLRDINKFLLEYRKSCEGETCFSIEALDDKLYGCLYRFLNAADSFLSEHPNKQTDDYRNIFELYFSVSRFLTLYDNRSDAHHLFYDPAEDSLKLFCSDAQEFLRARLGKGQSGIFFSATLTPLSYHCELLGGDREDYLLDVPGIFDPSHFMILCDVAVKTSYRQRESYYPIIAQHIHAIVQSHICNKFVFFPSYEFLLKVREEYERRYDDSLLVQKRYMNESERSAFLAEFEEATGITAFAVAGGVFSEGIDLVGERLGGVIVCGVSLPKVCMERELIRAHFDAEGKNGFDYAYLIPGMNKVLQSMGRVIRTESDIGYAVLMDERFSFAAYRNCLPPHYDRITTVRTELDLIGALKKETEEHG